MSSPVEDTGQMAKPEGAEPCCDPTCSCKARGLSTKAKTGICVVVALAAVVVLLVGSANKVRAVDGKDPFTTASAPVSPTPSSPAAAPVAPSATDTPAASAATQQAQTEVWGATLSSIASLNEVAADRDAVFVFVPAKDDRQTAEIRRQVSAATRKAQSQGARITAYMLAGDAKEYAAITSQVPAPCVLAMSKGMGTVPVDGEITETKLLEALVTASRPSSCGPSGCGPSGCG